MVARGQEALLAVDEEADLSADDVEALGEGGVEVLGRDAAARADEQMSDEDPVRMLRGVGQDHDPLARDRVLQDLAPPVHVGHVGIFPNPANAQGPSCSGRSLGAAMGEVIEGIGAEQQKRIDALRKAGGFFWIDVSLSQTSREALGKALGIPDHALDPLLGFKQDLPPSRKFHVDDDHVVFAFTCFLDQPDEPEAIDRPLNPLEVHILITGDYILTLHQRAISLPDVLDPDPPAGRSEQYVVYAILDAMVATGFDALNEAELTLEGMQLISTDMRAARVRMGTLRAVNSRLARMRRRLGPQRGIFERISEEIGRIKGLEADNQQYFERIYSQLSRLVDGIDAASDGDGEADRPAPQRDDLLADRRRDGLPAAHLRHRVLRHELRLDGRPHRLSSRVPAARHRGVPWPARLRRCCWCAAAAPRSSPTRRSRPAAEADTFGRHPRDPRLEEERP